VASSELAELGAAGEEALAHGDRILRFFEGLVSGDEFARVEAEQVRVHRDHAEGAACLDIRRDAVGFIFADQRLDRSRGDHNLKARDAAAADLFAEYLGDDTLDRRRQLRANHVLHIRRERIDDTVDGLRGAVGVKGAEDQVAGFGGADCGLDGFEVAHFTDENDVGVLTQGAPDGLGKIGDVDADLALGDDAALMVVVVFDRVLDGDDVPVAVLVDVIDHRGERGRFARTGRAGDEDEAARTVEEFLDLVGEADVAEREHAVGDLAEHEAVVALALEDAHAEAGLVLKGEAEVAATVKLHVLLVVVGRDREHQVLGVLRRQVGAVDRHHGTGNTQRGRLAHLEMEIGGILLDHQLEQVVHFVRHRECFEVLPSAHWHGK
jgi:hypothetical protein